VVGDVAKLKFSLLRKLQASGGILGEFPGYLTALASVGVALLIRLSLDPCLANSAPYFLFSVAVMVTIWLTTWRPAVLAIVIGTLLGRWFFVAPRHSLAMPGLAHYSTIGLFVLVGGMLLVLVQALRSALRRAETAAEALQESQLKLEELNLQLESKVSERTAKLKETIGKLEHISYSLTHDLRAPLRAIHGFAELLLGLCGERIGAEGKKYLRQIVAATDRLSKMIQDALNYGRVTGAEAELRPVDSARLVRALIESHPQFRMPDAEVSVEGELPVVLGNEMLLTQCFSNLLGNAVKFVPRGTIPRVKVFAETEGDCVRFWVEDNGIGIAKESQKRIFEMFERAAPDHEGTGIGLAIVHEAAERMGGKTGVESELGQGSRFWLELPRMTPVND
jgi:signal transduction histidine kinase